MTSADIPRALRNQLNDAAAAFRDGGDMAPALRFGIEAQLNALLSDRPQCAQSLCDVLRELLPRAELAVDATGMRLVVWQDRAPVVPSTKG
jgi:hypothetical protein